MGIFMELRCELRGEGLPESSGVRCWSDDNEGPMAHGFSSKKGAADCYGEIVRQAKEAGWKKKKDGWVCPNCLKREASLVEGNANAE